MPTRQYTPTESGGFVVETRASSKTNAVEIYDKSTGNIVDTLNDITDLRNAKQAADPGERIRVLPGEYNTKNLLKDQVDWHFEEGAVVDNEGLSRGAFFGNVGAHGSPGGQVRSTVTGDGVFEWNLPENKSGFFFANIGSNANSEISIEAKRYTVPDGSAAILASVSNGDVDIDIDTFESGNSPVSFGNVALNVGRLSGDNSDSKVNVSIGTLDASGRNDGLGILGQENSGEAWEGDATLSVENLITSEGGGEYLHTARTTSSNGTFRISVKNHEGDVGFGILHVNANTKPFLEDFEIEINDGGAFTFFFVDEGEVYASDTIIDHPTADAATDEYTFVPSAVGNTGDMNFIALDNVAVNGNFEPNVSVTGKTD